ncbi:MAG: 1-acyl-sn-glycerol-3-phosphate acyltransferase [Bacteroidaceae bacterium]|nr:1-acyl-sn-glycerol-3-phosphate acyltransferase [Bacteroidaceae bacterium]
MIVLYRIYQLCIAAPLILVATLLTAVVTIIGSAIGGAHYWGYWPACYWSKFICAILLLPLEVEGMERVDPNTSYVFVANHQGSFDIFLIYAVLGRNFKWMMKKELRKVPFIGKACDSARHIFVDNSTPRKTKETMEKAKETLQGGTSLVVFPEGSRTFTGKMGVFKKGAYLLAAQIQLPIVPMTIEGSFDVLPRMKGISFVERHKMKLTLHRPIDSSDPTAALSQSRQIIEDSLKRDR